jgi:N6-adenosine-specific RNA methylase IME4
MEDALVRRVDGELCVSNITLSKTGAFIPADTTEDEWERAWTFLRRAEGSVMWWLGDMLVAADDRWHDAYDRAKKDSGFADETLRNAEWVSSSVDPVIRITELSWRHHQVVAPMPARQQKKWLAKALSEGWSVAELKKAIRESLLDEAAEANPIPEGKYRVIYADPPWFYNDQRTGTSGSGGAASQYLTMETEKICELPIREKAHDSSVLFLWATAPCLPDALQVIEAWGFSYKAQFVWDKVRGFNGHYNDVCHELLLIATKGSCLPKTTQLRKSVITVEKTKHSRKPDDFYELIEELYDGPYAELFARRERTGWTPWGNEIK